MTRIQITRRKNLRLQTVTRAWTYAKLALRLRVSRAYISQLIGIHPTRGVTHASARKFEFRLRIAPYSLDR